MGRRIVMTSFGSYGDVFPYLGMAHGLRARGHEPVIATSEYYRDRVEAEGFGFHPVRPDVDPTDRELVGRIMDPVRGTEFIVRDLLLSRLRESFEDLSAAVDGAALLITHPITFAGPLVAERTGIPWASSVLAPMSFFSPHDLPVFPPAPGLKRLERVPGAAALLVALGRRMIRGWGAPVHALRRELGLAPGGDPIFEGQHAPQLVLALFSRVLAEPQPDWPPNVVVTGGIPYNGPTGELELSPGLSAFLAAGPPPVVFTLGSSAVGAAGGFYRESVEAIRRLGVRAVLLVGPHADNHPPSLPAGVHLEPFAAHAALFPRAAAVVHQGGVGTLHQGLRAGRPSLVVPFAHDQPDNAYRAQRLGVSRTLAFRRYTAARVERALGALLGDGGYAARAATVGATVRGEDAVGAACDAIEALFRAGSGGAPGR
jgi:rhamnosyltransferase subunit B